MDSRYEMGSIYTLRGLDLNYIGLVIGPDLYFDKKDNEIKVNKKNLYSNDVKKNATEEEIKEYFYTAQHNAKIFINQSRLNSKDYTTVDDNWYNSNIHDLCFISGFGDEQIFDIKCSTKRQIDTINEGRNELKNDYYSTLKYINFSKM